ncbi:MAG: hypothetical protein K6D38_08500 [Pseudobutyrivibrio sp.]|nr:hypothetical protein [Pseudobutyrivibrio sp.]
MPVYITPENENIVEQNLQVHYATLLDDNELAEFHHLLSKINRKIEKCREDMFTYEYFELEFKNLYNKIDNFLKELNTNQYSTDDINTKLTEFKIKAEACIFFSDYMSSLNKLIKKYINMSNNNDAYILERAPLVDLQKDLYKFLDKTTPRDFDFQTFLEIKEYFSNRLNEIISSCLKNTNNHTENQDGQNINTTSNSEIETEQNYKKIEDLYTLIFELYSKINLKTQSYKEAKNNLRNCILVYPEFKEVINKIILNIDERIKELNHCLIVPKSCNNELVKDYIKHIKIKTQYNNSIIKDQLNELNKNINDDNIKKINELLEYKYIKDLPPVPVLKNKNIDEIIKDNQPIHIESAETIEANNDSHKPLKKKSVTPSKFNTQVYKINP